MCFGSIVPSTPMPPNQAFHPTPLPPRLRRSGRAAGEPECSAEQRSVTIPPNVWHQALVADTNWVVVSFQTVSAEDLIEERPDAADASRTQPRKYILPSE
jgi:hypothetical protein